MTSFAFLTASVMTALLILCAATGQCAQPDKPPVVSPSNTNILFILVDDMGWRDLACYGHEIHETPHVDRLASEGMRFTDAYAPRSGVRPVSLRDHDREVSVAHGVSFGDTIHELDWSVGVILKSLEDLGIDDNTLVIFTSDNGGYPRDFNGHYPMGPVLRGGKGDLVEGGHRVPFVAKWPGRIPPGTVSSETISTVDMLATFAAIVGNPLPKGAGPDSYNVLPAFLGEALPDPERPLVFISGGTGAFSIRSGKWKFIEGKGNRGYGEFRRKRPWPKPKPGDPPAQLYNLDEDLGEANNLYSEHPEIVQRLKRKLKEIRNAGD